jgi:hypothetical protein
VGGAILIGTGDIEISGENLELIIRVPPYRYLYTLDQRAFEIDGLQVDLINKDTGITVRSNIPYSELSFLLGDFPMLPVPGYQFHSSFYGIIPITVEYTHSNIQVLHANFVVMVSGGSNFDFGNIKPANVIHLWPDNDINGDSVPDVNSWDFGSKMGSLPASSEAIIFVLHCDVIITSVNFGATGTIRPYSFLFVSAEPGHTIKRGNGVSIINWYSNAALTSWWFGIWPFNEEVHTILGFPTYPYVIDTVNAYDANGNLITGVTQANKLLLDGQATGMNAVGTLYNVRVDPGVTVIGDKLY